MDKIEKDKGIEPLSFSVEVTGFSSQLSKAPLELSPKFSQQRAARKIWSFVSNPVREQNKGSPLRTPFILVEVFITDLLKT